MGKKLVRGRPALRSSGVVGLPSAWGSLGPWGQLLILWFENGECFSPPFPFGGLDALSLWEPSVWGTETVTVGPHRCGTEDPANCTVGGTRAMQTAGHREPPFSLGPAAWP